MIRNMTKGSPTKLLLTFAFPMLIGNLFQQLYNLVDSIVVSHGVGVDAFTAVGCSAAVNFFIIGFIMGLCQGFSILVSRYFGANDPENLRKAVAMSIILSAISVVIVSVAAVASARGLLVLLDTQEKFLEDAVLYSRIVYACIGCLVFYNMTSAILRALGDSRTPLYAMIISCLCNVALDLLFVLVFHWGIAGAAIATAISQLLAMVYNIFRMRKIPLLHVKKSDFRLNRTMMAQMVGIGLPMGIQNSVTALGVMTIQRVVNGLGPIYPTAYANGMKIVNIIQQPNATFGMAVTTYVGQNIGAGDFKRVRQGVKRCVAINMVVCAVLCGAMLLFAPNISAFVMGEEATAEIIAASSSYIRILSCCLWILGILWPYRSALQGMGKTVVPMISGALELVTRIALVVTIPLMIGFTGIMVAEAGAWASATILLVIYYYVVIRKIKKKFEGDKL